MNREMGTRRSDIREDAGGTAEDIVFDLNALIDGDVVLDAHTIADAHIIAYIDVLAQGAVPAQTGAALHMAEMPYLGTLANLYIVIDVAGWMDEITHFG